MSLNGGLKFLVLKELSNKKQNGSSMYKSIREKTGWKVSPGSLYPLMKDLVNAKLVTFVKDANIKTYSITKRGKDFIQKVDTKKKEIITKLNEGFSFLKILGEDTLSNFPKKLINETKYLPLCHSIYSLKEALFNSNLKEHNKKINDILEGAANKIKDIK